jgi:hypothetical protein
MMRFAQIHGLAFSALATVQAAASSPTVPDAIKAPLGERLVLEAHATGAQIYVCRNDAGNARWVLDAPEAELFDANGAAIGRHYAGPTWKHKDGSEVGGKATARFESPDTNAIPWLLVSATSHSGNGVLARVTSIQRVHTKGGQPPSASDCNFATINSRMRSRYTADYYFYAPGK